MFYLLMSTNQIKILFVVFPWSYHLYARMINIVSMMNKWIKTAVLYCGETFHLQKTSFFESTFFKTLQQKKKSLSTSY